MPVAAAAAITAGAALYGANKNSKAGSAAMDAQKNMFMQDLGFRREQYDRYLREFGPIEDLLTKEARSEEPLDYGAGLSNLERNYASARRGLASSVYSRGIAGSGLDQGLQRDMAIGMANGKSNLYLEGLKNRRALGLSLLNHNPLTGAANGVSNALGGLAGFYGNQANLFNGAAGAGYKAAGDAISGLARWWASQPQSTPETTMPTTTQQSLGGLGDRPSTDYTSNDWTSALNGPASTNNDPWGAGGSDNYWGYEE